MSVPCAQICPLDLAGARGGQQKPFKTERRKRRHREERRKKGQKKYGEQKYGEKNTEKIRRKEKTGRGMLPLFPCSHPKDRKHVFLWAVFSGHERV